VILDWFRKQLASHQERQQEKANRYLAQLKSRYHTFRALLDNNNRAVELITDLGIRLRNSTATDPKITTEAEELIEISGEMVEKLIRLDNGRSHGLLSRHHHLRERITATAAALPAAERLPLCLDLGRAAEAKEAAGGKAVALGRLRAAGRYRVPNGFVIPVHACRFFLEQDNLSFRLVEKLQPHLGAGATEVPETVVAEIRDAIFAAALPTELARALAEASRPFFKLGQGLAVRSSAVSEDGRMHSFAGQFATVLNVTQPTALVTAFKEVVASAFNGRSLAYRLNAGLDPLAFEMAVLCLEMVPARSAGILFTRDPNQPEADRMLATGVLGLGELAVSGTAVADLFAMTRAGKPVAAGTVIAEKNRRLVCLPEGGVGEEEIPAEERLLPALNDQQLKTLADWSLAIEKEAGCPQDVEWAIDADGEPVILQARPLRLARQSRTGPARRVDPAEILLADGVATSAGEATGRARVVRSRQDLQDLGEGPIILVLHQSMVDAVNVLARVSGVLVDLGNPADHLSCVAREYALPMVTGLRQATTTLADGQWLTVDGHAGLVCKARPSAIAEAERLATDRAAAPRTTAAEAEARELVPELEELRQSIVQLNLTDAYGSTFSIQECRSIHDIVRYIHEKAVLAMFSANDETLEETSGIVVNLESEVPFILSIIDLGGGLVPRKRKRRRVTPEEIVSPPFKALWRGIATPGLHWGAPGGGNINGVMSNWLTDHRSARPIGMPNYLIVSRDYLNLNARMDFHFTMIDSLCGFDPHQNYVKFRFKGGGTSQQQRHRRVQCIARMLEAHDFFTDARDDLVHASLIGVPREVIEEKLTVLGQVLGFTRLLDAVMASDAMVERVAEAFLAGNYHLDGIKIDKTENEGEDTVQA